MKKFKIILCILAMLALIPRMDAQQFVIVVHHDNNSYNNNGYYSQGNTCTTNNYNRGGYGYKSNNYRSDYSYHYHSRPIYGYVRVWNGYCYVTKYRIIRYERYRCYRSC